MNINIRSIVLIGIALLLAGVTAMLARNLVGTPGNGGTETVVKIVDSRLKVLVSAIDMPVGHFVKAEDMVWQSWPDETVHLKYIKQSSGFAAATFAGSVAISTIAAGEPILDNRLVKPGSRGFMAAVLPVGKRAISIRISPTTGNAGFVFPGDRVDILLTHQVKIKSKDRDKARLSETVIRNVRVLAINQSVSNPTHTPLIGQTATLEVTPKEAEKVSLIKSMGELSLILRSIGVVESEQAQQGGEPKQVATDRPSLTWDSEISKQLSGSENSGKVSTVKIFRGSLKKAKSNSIDFNKLLKQAQNSGEDDDSAEESEEKYQ